jgi:hypothetical protein
MWPATGKRCHRIPVSIISGRENPVHHMQAQTLAKSNFRLHGSWDVTIGHTWSYPCITEWYKVTFVSGVWGGVALAERLAKFRLWDTLYTVPNFHARVKFDSAVPLMTAAVLECNLQVLSVIIYIMNITLVPLMTRLMCRSSIWQQDLHVHVMYLLQFIYSSIVPLMLDFNLRATPTYPGLHYSSVLLMTRLCWCSN